MPIPIRQSTAFLAGTPETENITITIIASTAVPPKSGSRITKNIINAAKIAGLERF